jgi:hypothetical protein
MTESFLITSENRPKRASRALVAEQLSLIRSIYRPGYWVVTDYPSAVPVNDLSSKHVIVSGGITETTGTLPYRAAGWISSNDTGIVPAGSWRRECPEGCEIWCIRSILSDRVDHVQVIQLNAGDSHVINVGENLFLAYGKCAVDDRNVELYRHFKIVNQTKTITASEPSYLFVWPTLPGPN